MTTVSIIIPVFNAERTLRETLKSVNKAPAKPQVIVINDGSRVCCQLTRHGSYDPAGD